MREPYKSVFTSIVQGIDDGLDRDTTRYALDGVTDPSALRASLGRDGVRVVIALGTKGVTAAKRLENEIEVIVGAVLTEPRENRAVFRGITLSPDPEILFERLMKVAPSAKRVTVIYDRLSNQGLIDRAHVAARSQALLLNAIPAEDLAAGARLYRTLLDTTAGVSEVIWIPQGDDTVDDNAVLPLVLKGAWDKKIVVISSNPSHVRKGALMALYPDNAGLGRSLAAMAMETLRTGGVKKGKFVPLRDLLTAVNIRTAEHLGLEPVSQTERQFDMVFPER
ncbi:MAG: ABC transporter substrate-binding protein [Pseudomonadota bacterium]|nr:ABC transporter substrate-binding protein [Pseudomonadota bacterium]